MSKHKLSKLSERDEEALSKLSRKERSKAVEGTPDQQDIDDLTALFTTYDKFTGDMIKKMAADVATERAINNRELEPIETAEKLSFWMPKDLQEEVETYWPTIWSNKDHLRWFLKNFPIFRL